MFFGEMTLQTCNRQVNLTRFLFLLHVIIDICCKFAWVVCVKDQKNENFTKLFQEIFEKLFDNWINI